MSRLGALLQGRQGKRRVGTASAAAQSPVLGSLAISGAQVVAGVLFALASLYVIRSFQVPEYGRVAFGLYAYTLLQAVAGLGLSAGVLAETARGRGAGGVAWPIVQALVLVRLLTVIPVLLVGIAWSLASQDVLPVLASIVASTAIVAELLIGVLAGLLRTAAYVFVVVAQPAGFLLLLVLFEVRIAEDGLVALGVALAVSLLIALSFFGHPTWPSMRRPRVSVGELGHAIGVARTAYVVDTLHIGFVSIPLIVLGELGRYVEAASLSIVMTLVRFAPDALGRALIASYLSRLKAVDPGGDEARALFGTFVRQLALFTIPAAIGLAVMGRPLLAVLFTHTYDELAPFVALASALVVLLPAEGLLVWTLVSRGDARGAMSGPALRLGLVVATCVFALVPGDRTFLILVLVASVTGVLLSVGMLALRTRRTGPPRWPVTQLATYGLVAGGAYLATRALMPAEASDMAVVVAAAFVTVPVLGLGSWILRPKPAT